MSVKAIISAAVADKNEPTTGKSVVVAVSLVEAPLSAKELLGALSLVEESFEAPLLDALSFEACCLRPIVV